MSSFFTFAFCILAFDFLLEPLSLRPSVPPSAEVAARLFAQAKRTLSPIPDGSKAAGFFEWSE